MRLVMATLCTYWFMSKSMTDVDYRDRLLSYYLLKDLDDIQLHSYVKTGYSHRKPKTRTRNWTKNRVSYLRIRKLALANRLKRYEECTLD
jgi:hypothetical protein